MKLLVVAIITCIAGAWFVGTLIVDASWVPDVGTVVTLPPTPVAAVPPTISTSTTALATTTTIGVDVWDRLATCESHRRWSIHNAVHEGGLQFAVDTWDAYKPAGYPDGAHQATREQQIIVALRVRDGVPGTSHPYLNAQGWAAWPRCSRKIGLRP